jgi:ribonuclease HI
MAKKFYVVWAGRQTGVFADWPTVQRAVIGYPGARYKSFQTRSEAEEAFAGGNLPGVESAGPLKRRRSGSERAALHVAHRFEVSIYCDGACEPNPGDAGSGIVVYRNGELAELWYGLYHPMGTNNTAELNALYHALRMAETEIGAGRNVEVCSDSVYAINCVRAWAPSWEKKGWTRTGGEIKNLEIIQACYEIDRRIKKKLTLSHVAGHVGTEGNEIADRMAMLAVRTREKKLRQYLETMDIPTLLRMRAG